MFLRVRHLLLPLCCGFFLMAAVNRLSSGRDETPATVTAPAQNELRFVHDDGTPLANGEKVRVLCYATDAIGAPLSDLTVTVGANGVATEPAADDCRFVAALHLLHEQPSGKPDHGPAYRVYATSWDPHASQPSSVDDDIVILGDEKLVLFAVVAALEWQPEAGSQFVSNLHTGLEAASDYLYDFTDGQMAFGPVSVHVNGRYWNSADLRFRSANDYRPSAYVGGIVPERTAYDVGGTYLGTLYAPGAALFGRHWDGQGAGDRPEEGWADHNAYRTIVHEWAHYALFLYDEYTSVGGGKTYCTGRDNRDQATDATNASIMDYPYTTSELWHGRTHGFPESCLNTVQYQVHGATDWQTLAQWDQIQGLTAVPDLLTPPTTLQPGPPPGITADLFGSRPGHALHLPIVLGSGARPPRPDDVNVFVNDADDAVEAALSKQVYLLEGGPDSPSRITYQGRPLSRTNEITLLGVAPSDRARVHLESYQVVTGGNGLRYTYPPTHLDTPDALTDGVDLVAETDGWPVSLDVIYELSGSKLTTMTIVLDDTDSADVTAQICVPDAAVGCPAEWNKALDGATRSVAFTPLPGQEELPLYGTMRVSQRQDGALTGEIVRWFLVGGGVGPAHNGGDAPSRDGLVTVDIDSPSPAQACNRVIIMPAASHDALTSDALPVDVGVVHALVGGPYELDILLPDGDGNCTPSGPGDRAFAEPVTLTLFYNQGAIDRLGANEDELGILYFNRTDGTWTRVDGLHRDAELNSITTEPVTKAGIYAIFWLGRR